MRTNVYVGWNGGDSLEGTVGIRRSQAYTQKYRETEGYDITTSVQFYRDMRTRSMSRVIRIQRSETFCFYCHGRDSL